MKPIYIVKLKENDMKNLTPSPSAIVPCCSVVDEKAAAQSDAPVISRISSAFKGEFQYELNADGTSYSVVGIDCAQSGAIVVSSVHQGMPVTGIGHRAFLGCHQALSLTIEEGVTGIGEEAFALCDNLTAVHIPKSVTSIGDGAFSGCRSLQQITVDQDNPIYHAEENCLIEKATRALIVGCSMCAIPAKSQVKTIRANAFHNLTHITIPSSVMHIDSHAFDDCTQLTCISADDNATYHAEGNCLIETATKTLVLGCKASVIPCRWQCAPYWRKRFCRLSQSAIHYPAQGDHRHWEGCLSRVS